MIKLSKIGPKFLFYSSICLVIVIGLFNTSMYGASLSWAVAPVVLCIMSSILLGKIKSERKIIYGLSFYSVCFVSTLLSPVVSLQRDIVTLGIFFIMYIFMTSQPRQWVWADRIIMTYIIVALLGACLICINYFRGIYYNEWFRRSTVVFMGVSKDPNYVAAFIAPLPILVMLYSPKKKRRYNNILKLFIVSIGFVSMILNGSRGAILSASISLVLYVLYKIKNPVKRMRALIVLIILLFVGYFMMIRYLPEQTLERLFFQTSADTRSDLWIAGLEGLKKNPVFGQGLGAASYYSNLREGNYSHNMYIDILSGTGLVGFILYAALIKREITGKYSIRSCWNQGLFFAGVALFLPQFFINGFNTLSMFLPLIMSHYLNIYVIERVNVKSR